MKHLYENNQNKNYKIVKKINESLINLINSTDSKEITGKGNPKQIANFVEKVFELNKQQKGKEHR